MTAGGADPGRRARAESDHGWTGDYEEETRAHYRSEQVAEQYATALAGGWAPRVITALERRAIAKGIAALGGRRDGDRILDVPAGTGKLTGDLTSGPASRYVAADVSPNMLARIRRRVPRVVADATALPFADARFDLVVSLRLYHRVPADLVEAMVRDAVRAASRGVVVSYAGSARFGAVHRLLRRLGRRPPVDFETLATDRFAALVARAGGVVVHDRSISAGLTAERVAAIRPATVR